MSSLIIRAGSSALTLIRNEGLRSEHVRVLAGAAGGPKWLALAGLDRYLFGEFFKHRTQALATIGSSIATWRFTAAAQDDPVAAIDRFEAAYLAQQYSDNPDAEEISAVCRWLLDQVLPEENINQLLHHRYLRPHILAARCLGRSALESPRELKMGLARIAMSNLRGRQRLSQHMQRAIFHVDDGRYQAPFLPFTDQFETHQIRLTADNLKPALLASASIPLLMQGEADIAGAPPGMYRDGGLIDYHMDIHYQLDDGIVLFPHFGQRIVPGWLDKFLPWRKPHAHHLDRVLMIAPSDELLARLPNGKIPDRKDFNRYKNVDDLMRDWATATRECRRMADELAELIDNETLADHIQPFPDDHLRHVSVSKVGI